LQCVTDQSVSVAMAVAVASAPQLLAAGHVAEGNGTGTLKSSNGHVANGSPYQSGLFDFGSGHHGHLDGHHGVELRCSKCSCLPVDCQCVESHAVGPAYFPNPNETDLVSKTNQRMLVLLSFAFHPVTLTLDERLPCMQPREFETHVQIFVRVPEMQEVEETHYKKEVIYEKGTQTVPKSVLTYDVVEHFEMVPVVRHVTKTRQEVEYM
jgi:hypothetical protein